MPLFNWGEIYITGHELIDDQHCKLVDIINNFYSLKQNGLKKENVLISFDELAKYTKYHFQAEEELLKSLPEEKYKHHKAAHEKLIFSLVDMKVQMKLAVDENEFQKLYMQFCMFLCKWLSNHILIEDKDAISVYKQTQTQALR